MKNKILLAFGIVVLFTLQSCVKTNPISGCTDPTASNYNSSANQSCTGCCEYYGNVVFWSNNVGPHGGEITVTVDGSNVNTVTVNFASAPDCLSGYGNAFFHLSAGTHSYSTRDYYGNVSAGTITIAADMCTRAYIP